MPDLAKGPHRLVKEAVPADIETSGLQGDPFVQGATVITATPSITWRNAELSPIGIGILKIGVEELPRTCQKIMFTFDATGETTHETLMRLDGRAPGEDITYGTIALVNLNPVGRLKLTLECPIGTRLQFNELASYSASMGEYYSQRLQPKN